MAIKEELKSLFTRFQKYTVKFKDGYFHLHNIANSPQTMIDSFAQMPFIKHDKNLRKASYKSLFVNGQFYYLEIETGLWVFVSELDFKRNVVIHNLFDPLYPSEYNIVNLHFNNTTIKSQNTIINGMLLSDRTWAFFRPGKIKRDYHFKDSLELNVTIYFTDEWFYSNFQQDEDGLGKNLIKFFETEYPYLFIDDIGKDTDNYYTQFLKRITEPKLEQNKENIRTELMELIHRFLTLYNQNTEEEGYITITDKDRKAVQKAVHYLMDNLTAEFPGIDETAKYVGVSSTKIKADFKQIHKKSLFQYFRFHQMQLAEKLLTEKSHSVKEVAELLGYSNTSKFSTSFKNQFGVLPSEKMKE